MIPLSSFPWKRFVSYYFNFETTSRACLAGILSGKNTHVSGTAGYAIRNTAPSSLTCSTAV